MDECHTPTIQTMPAFIFNKTTTPKMRNDERNSKMEMAQNRKTNRINVRCYTPIHQYFLSPNLSPICNMRHKSPVTPMLHAAFKRPKTQLKKSRYSTSSLNIPTTNKQTIQQKKQQQQQQQQYQQEHQQQMEPLCNSDSFNACNSSLKSEDSSASENDNSMTNTGELQMEDSYVLNHAANVNELLMHVGLDSYVDKFEEAHIDLEQLVHMQRNDLEKMGLDTDEECNHILKVLNAL